MKIYVNSVERAHRDAPLRGCNVEKWTYTILNSVYSIIPHQMKIINRTGLFWYPKIIVFSDDDGGDDMHSPVHSAPHTAVSGNARPRIQIQVLHG